MKILILGLGKPLQYLQACNTLEFIISIIPMGYAKGLLSYKTP